MTNTLRLDVYEALEDRSYRAIQDLALRLGGGAVAWMAALPLG
jgi:hypothetical protein